MHAKVEPTLPLVETVAGRKAKASVINRAVRLRAYHGAFRCTCCGGRCDVEVRYADDGTVAGSKGKCRTPGCIVWED